MRSLCSGDNKCPSKRNEGCSCNGARKKKVGLQDYQEENYPQDDDSADSVDDSEDGNLDGGDGDEDSAVPSNDDTTQQVKTDKVIQPTAVKKPVAASESKGVFAGAMAKIKSLKFW